MSYVKYAIFHLTDRRHSYSFLELIKFNLLISFFYYVHFFCRQNESVEVDERDLENISLLVACSPKSKVSNILEWDKCRDSYPEIKTSLEKNT